MQHGNLPNLPIRFNLHGLEPVQRRRQPAPRGADAVPDPERRHHLLPILALHRLRNIHQDTDGAIKYRGCQRKTNNDAGSNNLSDLLARQRRLNGSGFRLLRLRRPLLHILKTRGNGSSRSQFGRKSTCSVYLGIVASSATGLCFQFMALCAGGTNRPIAAKPFKD